MKQMTNREKGSLVTALGHARLKVEATASGNRWKASCSCGWNTGPTDPTRATQSGAVGHARWHVEKVLEAYFAAEKDGVSVPHLQASGL